MKLRINEKETPNIEVKHEGILEVPEGKKVDELPYSHFEKLAKEKGLSKITKALNNLQVWNKNDDTKLSKWAGEMIDKLNKKLKKDERFKMNIKESIDLNDYEYRGSISDDTYIYDLYCRFDKTLNKGIWAAVKKSFGEPVGEPFAITYQQALEQEPISDPYGTKKLQRQLSKKLGLVKESKENSYWKYSLSDRAIERIENSDRYFDERTIRQVKLYPCANEDECYEGDFWPVRKSYYPYTEIFGTKDEAYEELMYYLNNSMYEEDNDL